MEQGHNNDELRHPTEITNELHTALVAALNADGWVTRAGARVTDAYDYCFATQGDHADEARVMMPLEERFWLKSQVVLCAKPTAESMEQAVRSFMEHASKYACVALEEMQCRRYIVTIVLRTHCSIESGLSDLMR